MTEEYFEDVKENFEFDSVNKHSDGVSVSQLFIVKKEVYQVDLLLL
jgi:hypothetical protein